MAEKIAVVTGSTDGLGRMVATRLATEHVFRVIVHGRDGARGNTVVGAIARAGGTATFMAADLASLADVRKFAAEVDTTRPHIDLLINNAGIGGGGTIGKRQESRDGHELRFAVNYLAGFLLTHLLLPLLKAAAQEKGGARIVNVASAGQQAIDFSDVMLTRHYSGVAAYCQSKLAQIMFTIDLAHELEGSGVTVNALHPATYMDTTMVRQSGVTPISSVEEGAEAILKLATSPELDGRSGLFFNGLREARADTQAYDAEARQRLKAASLKLPPSAETASATRSVR
jgi:NAD(P)-dependent dehydrogenase (short-subunit alcohol dehydrogenase family)